MGIWRGSKVESLNVGFRIAGAIRDSRGGRGGTQRAEGFTIDDFGFLNEGEWIG